MPRAILRLLRLGFAAVLLGVAALSFWEMTPRAGRDTLDSACVPQTYEDWKAAVTRWEAGTALESEWIPQELSRVLGPAFPEFSRFWKDCIRPGPEFHADYVVVERWLQH